MSTLIKNLHIQNFKSVRDLSLNCDRINIFIGKPNAGKSNILEAVSLLGADYSKGKFMEGQVRYSRIEDIFSDFSYQNSIEVLCDDIAATFSFNDDEFTVEIRPNIASKNNGSDISKSPFSFFSSMVDSTGHIKNTYQRNKDEQAVTDGCSQLFQQFAKGLSPVKKYIFKFSELNNLNSNQQYLLPPHGENFYFIVRSHKALQEEIQAFLKPNGLKLFLDEATKRVSVVRETEFSFLNFPLQLIPDTFQRYMFHAAAIMSNRNSVLLFEEPEAHSYGPYIYQLAQHILNDEGGNQYFITTHNPYFLLPLMQEGKDVAIFTTWFEDYQTHAKRLSEDEIRDILDYGMDVFLNLDHFIPA